MEQPRFGLVRGCSDGKQKRVKEASRLQLSNRHKHVYLLQSIHVVARSKHTLLCNWKISDDELMSSDVS